MKRTFVKKKKSDVIHKRNDDLDINSNIVTQENELAEEINDRDVFSEDDSREVEMDDEQLNTEKEGHSNEIDDIDGNPDKIDGSIDDVGEQGRNESENTIAAVNESLCCVIL